jgi:hypothetical protein
MAQLVRTGKSSVPPSAALPKGDDRERGRLFCGQAVGWNDFLDDPAFIGQLIKAVLKRRSGGPAIGGIIVEQAQRPPFGVPPGHMERGKLFRHGTSNLYDAFFVYSLFANRQALGRISRCGFVTDLKLMVTDSFRQCVYGSRCVYGK